MPLCFNLNPSFSWFHLILNARRRVTHLRLAVANVRLDLPVGVEVKPMLDVGEAEVGAVAGPLLPVSNSSLNCFTLPPWVLLWALRPFLPDFPWFNYLQGSNTSR